MIAGILSVYLLNGLVLAQRLRATDGISLLAAVGWVLAWPALLAWHCR